MKLVILFLLFLLLFSLYYTSKIEGFDEVDIQPILQAIKRPPEDGFGLDIFQIVRKYGANMFSNGFFFGAIKFKGDSLLALVSSIAQKVQILKSQGCDKGNCTTISKTQIEVLSKDINWMIKLLNILIADKSVAPEDQANLKVFTTTIQNQLDKIQNEL